MQILLIHTYDTFYHIVTFIIVKKKQNKKTLFFYKHLVVFFCFEISINHITDLLARCFGTVRL